MKPVIFITVLTLLAGCTSDAPRLTKVNGHTTVQTDKRFVGLKVYTSTEQVRTKEQKLADLEVEKETREQEQDLKTEERQQAAAFWFGSACLLAAAGCVVTGYLSQGWKFWGGLAALFGSMGAASWGAESLIPYLKWGAGGLVIAAVLRTMWALRDFHIKDYLKKRKEIKLAGFTVDR